MDTTILYIHGAFSTRNSFNYLRDNLPTHKAEYITYEVTTPLSDILEEAIDTLSTVGNCHVVAHSLGGVIGLALSQSNPQVESIVTISSPFGGSNAASMMGWISSHPLYATLNPSNPILRYIRNNPLPEKHTNVVTTYGDNPLITGKNDSVVTISSQKSIGAKDEVEIPFNHFEALMCVDMVNILKDRIWGI